MIGLLFDVLPRQQLIARELGAARNRDSSVRSRAFVRLRGVVEVREDAAI